MDDLMCDDVLILQLVYTVKSAHQQPITAFKVLIRENVLIVPNTELLTPRE